MNGGTAYSCYSCHDRIWVGEGPPADHTELKGGVAWHKPGYNEPDTNCTQCHGPNLDDGFAPSCFSCHGPGGGPPSSHDQNLNGTMHKPGYETPFDSEIGCTPCHGPNLNDGAQSSCFKCHGARWADPHDFTGELWLPPGENPCYVCHLPPEFNPGIATSDPVWNHALPSSTYVVSPTTGPPTDTSLKCLGCHEGEPGPAVEDYGGNTGGTYFVDGEEAFGTDLRHHHPVSFIYNSGGGGLNDPANTESGRTRDGTIAEDMLENDETNDNVLQCTACHDQHDNSKGNYLYETPEEGLCFTCHTFVAAVGTHHIPGRDDPWGDGSGTIFNCTMCHGADLAGVGEVPGC
ncbi:MAG: cytochrome c3 family protein, partial [Planctomycetota bacterium]